MDLAPAHAAVIARPRDDAPRARFADVVAQAEPETATFIRAQLDIASRRRQSGRRDRAIEMAAHRCAVAPASHDARGVHALRRLLHGSLPEWAQRIGYGRGFAERVVVDAAWFAAGGAELTALAPVLDVSVFNSPCDPVELFNAQAWSHVRSLRFLGPTLQLRSLHALVRSPFLSRLAVLDVSFAGLPEEAIHLIASSAALPGLRYVLAQHNAFPDINRSVDEQDGARYGERNSAFAEDLALRYGPLPWLNGIPSELEPESESFK